jgi:hypothetical protein
MVARIVIYTLMIFVSVNIEAKHILSDWVTNYHNDQVTLDYRWILIGDTLKTREVRASFVVHAGKDIILSQLRNARSLEQWAVRAQLCKIFDQSDDNWITYTLFDVPWPLTRQELVTISNIVENNKGITISMEAYPEYLPRNPGVKRIQQYNGKWIITSVNDQQTRIEFYSASYTKPVVPRKLQDPVVQRILANSFEKLIDMAESGQKEQINAKNFK